MKKKRIVIIMFLLVFLIGLFVLLLFNNEKEYFNNNVTLNHWWENSDFSIPFIRKIIETDKDIEAYGPWKEEPTFTKDNNKIYFQLSCEPFYHNPELFDINIIPYEKETDNVIIMPYASIVLNDLGHTSLGLNWNHDTFLSKRSITNKSKFCLFSVSNEKCKARNDFFTKLSEHKTVDSCGKHLNNMNQPCPGYFLSGEYFEFVGKYKFMICFENTSLPNYFTEKLINAYYAGTIPIYWGCKNIEDYVNMESILYLKPDYTEEDMNNLIKEVIYLDNNDDAYKVKYENYFFKDGKLPDAFNIDIIKSKINKILNKTVSS